MEICRRPFVAKLASRYAWFRFFDDKGARMNVRRARSIALVALTAAVATAVPTTAASAATAPIIGGGSFARTVPFIDGSIYAFECHAAAPGAASTSVNSCLLGSIAAPPVTSQGPVATTSQAVSTNPAWSYRLCWTVSARYGDGTAQTTSGCTAASSIAGVG
jgi:hypothetical protein